MKAILWVYAVIGSVYFTMFISGNEPVVRHAVGPLWLTMVLAPYALAFLVFQPFLRRIIQRGGIPG